MDRNKCETAPPPSAKPMECLSPEGFHSFFFFTSSALLQVQTAKPFKRGEISLSVRATSGAVNLLLLGTTRHARALPAY